MDFDKEMLGELDWPSTQYDSAEILSPERESYGPPPSRQDQ